MSDFHFSCPIEVRYGDLDPQGHVNNANFLTYLEQARINYLVNLGLFSRKLAFMDVGIILADAHVKFISPVFFDSDLHADVQVTRLGNKSLTMAYRLQEATGGLEIATATTVLVTYDYRTSETISIPLDWREKIRDFERLLD